MTAGRLACRIGLFALAGAACAHVEPPSGGPEDRIGPSVLVTRPDTFAIVPKWNGAVSIVFTERLSEQLIEDAVMVSPRTSSVQVAHHGDEIKVDLRRGWEPGTIYHVGVRRIVKDLFGNRIAEPVDLVFSTGPEIPNTAAAGLVLDRITVKPDTAVRVEAIRTADSLVYATSVDSVGRFVLAHIPAGDYLLRAFRDVNRNRALDDFEASDTARATLAVGDTARATLSVVLPDTIPPHASSATLAAETRVEVKFDDYLDPAQEIAPAQVTFLAADSTPVAVAIAAVRVGTGPAPGDSAGARRTATPAAQVIPPLVAAPAAAGPVGPVPSQSLTLDLAADARLAPQTRYRIRIRGVRNIVGLSADVEVELTTPAPPPPPPAAPAPPGGGAL